MRKVQLGGWKARNKERYMEEKRNEGKKDGGKKGRRKGWRWKEERLTCIAEKSFKGIMKSHI